VEVETTSLGGRASVMSRPFMPQAHGAPLEPGRPGVSAVVCTYRREESLVATLGDLLSQQGSDLEILVMDQTPTHDVATMEFLEANRGCIRRMVLDRPNLPAARNEALRAATGEVVLFVDDDIRMGPDVVASLVRHFASPEVAVVAPVVVDDRGRAFALADYGRFWGRPFKTPRGDLRPVRQTIGACMGLRKEVALRIGGFDEFMGVLHPSASGEDYEFFRRLARAGGKSFIVPDVLVDHVPAVPGGCGVRTDGIGQAKRAQLTANVYILLKERGSLRHVGPSDWASLAWRLLVNRGTVSAGAKAGLQRWKDLRCAVSDVHRMANGPDGIDSSGSRRSRGT
jgi:glycosyltransferase involved in cell wall biosynthesis